MNTTAISITFPPRATRYDMQSVVATMSDGSVQDVFQFYTDEISFSQCELVGLTIREMKQLRFNKDVAYVQGG